MTAPSYHRLAAALRRRIRDGDIPVGAELPSRTELQAEYDVGLQTVNAAIIVLWTLGYIEATPGKATYARRADPPEDEERAAYFDGLV